MPGEANLWGDLDPVVVATKPPEEKQDEVLSEGYITDIITGDKQVKDTPKEQVRQFIAQALYEQYNIAYEDMQADFPIKVEDNEGKKRSVKIDIAIFHPGQEHIEAQLSRAVVCKTEPLPGKGTVKLRGHEEAKRDLDEPKAILQAIPSCKYGLWTNGLEFFYLEKEVKRFDIDLLPLAAWPISGNSDKEDGNTVARIPAR